MLVKCRGWDDECWLKFWDDRGWSGVCVWMTGAGQVSVLMTFVGWVFVLG